MTDLEELIQIAQKLNQRLEVIKKILLLFIILFYCETSAYGSYFPYSKTYSSENMRRIEKIDALISEYREAARKRLFIDLPPFREKWEVEYHDKINKLNSLNKNSMRYPDVYHNTLLFDQRIAIIKDYKDENAYQLYMSGGWAYSLEEKKKKIAKERTLVKSDALFCKQVLNDCRDKITNEYIEIFEELFKEKQSNLNFYYDYGLLAFLNNNFDKSSELLFALMDKAQETNQIDRLNAQVYHDLGSVCVEVMAYDKAIQYLSDAIRLDPSNKKAYFYRATAYFETGQFDLAMDDYLISDKIKKISRSKTLSNDFTKALCTSLCQGVTESVSDFVPSLCSTTYGIGKTLWMTAKAPVESTKVFSSACYEMGKCFVDYCKTIDSDTIDTYVDQLKELYHQFDRLSESEKGELIGYTIGKYGVDIFAGSFVGGGAIKGAKALTKGSSAYLKLKNVNRACNLEAMVASTRNKEKIVAKSLKHASEREAYFKNIKLELDKQNKHVIGAHNFELGKGEFMHPNPQGLLSKFAGKGKPINDKIPGTPDYRELVDFGEFIGYYRHDKYPELKLPTTKGTIRYSKKGAHIVPSHPDGK